VTRLAKSEVGILTKKRFCALWGRHEISGGGSDPAGIWAELLDHFTEPHRRYHGISHMEQCLLEFDQASTGMENSDAVEMALWFHDVIYAAGANDNEDQSANLFEHFAKHSLEEHFANEIPLLILDTKHIRLPATSNAKYTVDIDLSSFGRPWPEFMVDSHALRKEQPHLSDADFYQRKYAFMNSLLDRDSIYSTEYFHDRYESVARTNINRYLDLLKKQGSPESACGNGRNG
jgi:predicted metal-dependent HD superfamily phosphohydrolase